ncbi:hypothetical protein RCOM_1681050 [Ricinus communis]|uniref:Pentatricopeptide repeat-containing protein n=1 Tax=Ricinus communis TaxID=3988 RepID=B9RBU0_RICCO|nr:hypothetical protein RCOM_1681050 [Ricinus communis]
MWFRGISSGHLKLGNVLEAKTDVSWNSKVSGYASSGDMDQWVVYLIQCPTKNNISWVTMIAGYSKYGNVKFAWELFNRLTEKDLLSVNAMISCIAQNNRRRPFSCSMRCLKLKIMSNQMK